MGLITIIGYLTNTHFSSLLWGRKEDTLKYTFYIQQNRLLLNKKALALTLESYMLNPVF